jgi:hypothetical protein
MNMSGQLHNPAALPPGKEQFSLQMASPETFAYTLVGVSYGEGNSSVNSVSTC